MHLSVLPSPDHNLLLVFTVVPVVPLVLAGQEVGPVVPLTLQEFQQIMSAVVSLLQGQLGQVHLLLGCYHLCRKGNTIQSPTSELQESKLHENMIYR